MGMGMGMGMGMRGRGDSIRRWERVCCELEDCVCFG